MASVSATVRDMIVRDAPASTPNGLERVLVELYFDNGATAVAGGTDTLDVAVNTAIRARTNSGKTYTPRSYQVIQPAQSSATEYAATIGTSGSGSSTVLQLTPKSRSDWSTNATIAASALVGQVPYGLAILCDVS